MDTNEILTTALWNCAKDHNPKDHTEWAEKKSYPGMAIDLANQLETMGFRLEQFRFSLDENNSVLVNENGE